MTDIFNEDSLREAIVSIWGEHGAHIDVYDHILAKARQELPSTETDTDLSMEFATFIRKPFTVEAIEVTRENIHELSELIGEYGEDESGPYINADVENRLVPTVYRVTPGYWVTRMGRNIRCYSARVFFEQFVEMTPTLDMFMSLINEEEPPVLGDYGRIQNG